MKIKNFFSGVMNFIVGRKKTSIFIFIILLGIGYWGYGKLTSTSGETSYVTANVETGTLVTSISGTGQVSSSNQVDLKPKATGDVIYVGVTDGATVSAGTLLLQLDAGDAQKAVRDAEVNLESAKLSRDKLVQPADNLSLIQSENALAQASSTLDKAYEDGFNDVSDTFLTLPGVMSGLYNVLYTVSPSGQDNISQYSDMVKSYDEAVLKYRDDAALKYKIARESYDKSFLKYRSANRYASHDEIDVLVNDTYETTKAMADAVKSSNDLLGFVKDKLTQHSSNIPSSLTTNQNLLGTYTADTNNRLLTLSNIRSTVKNTKLDIAEKQASLLKLKTGADVLDIQSSDLTIKQRENALRDAQENLSHYYIRAPFDGTVAKVNSKKGDSVSSGTTVATFITKQKLAEISLNEVDAAKVSAGQKVTLTFDAVEDLTITGTVLSVDTVGTVSQGVVTYTVKIGFDTQDERIKSGMSVSAAIVTNVHQNVLLVPNSAVKTQNNSSYVLMFDKPLANSGSSTGAVSAVAPSEKTVTIGLSNDSYTEILSGLKEGDQVVTRSIAGTGTATTQAPSIIGAATGNRNTAGGGGRALGR